VAGVIFFILDSTCQCNRQFQEYIKRCEEIGAFSRMMVDLVVSDMYFFE
jgi:hypothetical protein